MRALSIRQPWAELILRGVKRVEYRSRPTRVIGERFWIYASKQPAAGGRRVWGTAAGVWSRDLAAGAGPPRWMWELAEELILRGGLPTGVIVGSAVIVKCVERSEVRDPKSDAPLRLTSDLRPLTSGFEWHLAGVERAAEMRKPQGHPQPVWFRPFSEAG